MILVHYKGNPSSDRAHAIIGKVSIILSIFLFFRELRLIQEASILSQLIISKTCSLIKEERVQLLEH